MMDKDDSGTLTKEEILHAVKNEDEVQKFLISCGNQNLSDLMVPSKLEKTLAELDTDKSGEVDLPEWEAAIAQALANKLEQRAKDRAEAAAKARAENEAFTKEFLNKAREVFELIDKDDSGSLAIDEITTAVKSDKVVKDFLKTCGDETLMFLLQPKRLDHALRELDTDGSGEVDIDEWEEAIRRGLSKRLEQLADERERRERAAAAEDEAFSAEFLFAARKVFMMIDEDDSGTLTKEEITTAVKANKEVIDFLVNCGNPNLQYLLVPARLEAALAELDTDRSGEVDLPEWCGRRVVNVSADAPHRFIPTQGGRHRERPQEQARGQEEGARGGRRGGAARDRGVHRALHGGRAALLRAHRQGRLGHADQGGDCGCRQERQGGHRLPQDVRRAEPRRAHPTC